MTPEQLAQAVSDLVVKMDNVSFAELASKWPDHFANGPLTYEIGQGLVIWAGLSETGADALDLLRAGKNTVLKPSSVLTYLADGRMLSLPVAKSARKYKKPHWVPSVLAKRS